MLRNMETMPLNEKVLLRPRRVAEMLDICVSAVYERIYAGDLPCVRIGRSVRVPAAAIKELVESAKAK